LSTDPDHNFYHGEIMTDNILTGTSVKLRFLDMDLDSIRLTDSKEYRFSKSQALAAIGRNKNYLARLRLDSPDKVQTLTIKGFTWVTVKVKFHDGTQYRNAETISLSDVRVLWRCEDRWGNPTASDLIDVLSEDSLFDRCDQVWGETRSQEARHERDRRMFDIPEIWSLMFDREVEHHLSRLSGFHKRDIRNGKLYWEFFYRWMTSDERIQMDAANPVLPCGRRKYKIHQFLTDETKVRMQVHIRAVFTLMKTARDMTDWRRMMMCYEGFDQMDFDFDDEVA